MSATCEPAGPEQDRCTIAGISTSKTAFVTDEIMLKHKCHVSHPESPDRLIRILQVFEEQGIFADENLLKVEARAGTDDEIDTVHDPDHRAYIDSLHTLSKAQIRKQADRWDSVYFCKDSHESARVAVGSCVVVTEAVCAGRVKNAIAVVRPPGHHAEAHCCMGFSLYNNVAVAAKIARQRCGANRVLIVDWDVHHGNGTQNMFLEDPNVLYISIHRWEHGKGFYPTGDAGAPTTVGSGAGAGFSVNIGWNQGHNAVGDTEYLLAFSNVIMPIAMDFNPDLVFVSAGFDAARGDPLGGCDVTPEGYARMTHMLCGLAEGRVIMALEGGYNTTSISYSFAACARVLLGHPPPPFSEPLRRPHAGYLHLCPCASSSYPPPPFSDTFRAPLHSARLSSEMYSDCMTCLLPMMCCHPCGFGCLWAPRCPGSSVCAGNTDWWVHHAPTGRCATSPPPSTRMQRIGRCCYPWYDVQFNPQKNVVRDGQRVATNAVRGVALIRMKLFSLFSS
eukprot:m.1162035 g.1162035  ORF g.1162035 m.1162035 type:complete len:505 (-) comp24501_c0_seq154:4496-6010(-)